MKTELNSSLTLEVILRKVNSCGLNYALFNSNDGTWELMVSERSSMNDLKQTNEDAFVLIPYDYKNQIEKLESRNVSSVAFPEPLVCQVAGRFVCDESSTHYFGTESVYSVVIGASHDVKDSDKVELDFSISESEYCKTIEQLQHEIQLGNVYEVNYCVEALGEGDIDPVTTYLNLNALTKAPYSALARFGDRYIVSGSPELFLSYDGDRLVSQPIKGTRKRSELEDEALIHDLKNSAKDRSENIMIADLVRNDLSKVAEKATVNADEICQVHTYESVHQLVSTISCKKRPECSLEEVIHATFPMGSMTGAPKIAAMKIIEREENFMRGAYSGTLGFVRGDGTYTFNVLIRTIIYDMDTKVISVPAGGAITIESVPKDEYEEVKIKLAAMKRALMNEG